MLDEVAAAVVAEENCGLNKFIYSSHTNNFYFIFSVPVWFDILGRRICSPGVQRSSM